jgi:asparagine synthase (glutamine-hydrolysing)
MSDVPVGVFLSGGVDSSSNVALMSELVSETLRAFSISFDGFSEAQNFHDIPYARRIAKEFGCRYQEVSVTAKECMDCLHELVYEQDEPIGDPACLPMHFVSKAARADGVVVVLVGEGSDEVFGGYPDMVRLLQTSLPRWRTVNRLPKAVRGVLYRAAAARGSAPGRVDLLRRAAQNEHLYWGLTILFWDTEKGELLQPHARTRMGPGSANLIQKYYEELEHAFPQADALQQVSFIELSNRLPELLLMRVDKFSMAHSLEARAPFLDRDLVSFAFSLPQHLKINGDGTKLVLKEAMRGILPEEVINRPKQGFRVPLPAWLGGELSGWAESLLFSSSLRRLDLFRFEYIDAMWKRHRSGVQDHSFDLWCLLNLSAWYEHWFG